MEKYYFTFGVGVDDPHRGCYHVETANTQEQAREAMFDKFGKYWAFCYTEEEWMIDPKEKEMNRFMCRDNGYYGDEPVSQADLFNLKQI